VLFVLYVKTLDTNNVRDKLHKEGFYG